jgi:hypothetical protein
MIFEFHIQVLNIELLLGIFFWNLGFFWFKHQSLMKSPVGKVKGTVVCAYLSMIL